MAQFLSDGTLIFTPAQAKAWAAIASEDATRGSLRMIHVEWSYDECAVVVTDGHRMLYMTVPRPKDWHGAQAEAHIPRELLFEIVAMTRAARMKQHSIYIAIRADRVQIVRVPSAAVVTSAMLADGEVIAERPLEPLAEAYPKWRRVLPDLAGDAFSAGDKAPPVCMNMHYLADLAGLQSAYGAAGWVMHPRTYPLDAIPFELHTPDGTLHYVLMPIRH